MVKNDVPVKPIANTIVSRAIKLRRYYDKTKPKNTPRDIVSNVAIIETNRSHIVVSQGQIVSRRINLALRHYAMFYGVDKNGVYWFLENNKGGVHFVNFDDFLAGQDHLRYEPRFPKVSLKVVLARAKKRERIAYDARHNNCEHFVHFLAFGYSKSEQAEIIEDIVEVIARVFIDATLKNEPNENKTGLRNLLENNLEKMSLTRIRDLYLSQERF